MLVVLFCVLWFGIIHVVAVDCDCTIWILVLNMCLLLFVLAVFVPFMLLLLFSLLSDSAGGNFQGVFVVDVLSLILCATGRICVNVAHLTKIAFGEWNHDNGLELSQWSRIIILIFCRRRTLWKYQMTPVFGGQAQIRSPWDEPLLLLFAVCLLCSGSFFASLWVCSYMQISKKDGIVRESIRIRSFWFCPDRTTGGKKLAKQLARQMRIQRLVQQWTFTCEHNEHAVPQASTECWRVSQSDREKCASRLGRRARSDAAQIIAEHCKNTTKHPRVKRKVVDSEAWPPCEGLETTQSTTEHRRSPQERSRIRKYHNGWNPADYRRAPQSTAEQHRELQPNLPQSTIQYCRFVFSSFPCLLFFCCFLPYKAGKTVRQVKPNCSRP